MRPPRLRSALTIALALVSGLVLETGRSQAVHPDPSAHDLEIPLGDFSARAIENAQTQVARSRVERALQQRFEGEWRVHAWNPQTETARSFFGSGAQVASGFASTDDLVAVARSLVRDNPEVFDADVDELRVWRTPEGLGKRSVLFQQTYQGLDVWGGRVRLVFTDAGRFFVGGSDFYRDILVDTHPSITESTAAEIARAALPFDPSTDRIEEGATLLILPSALTPDAVDHHLVWRVTVRTQEPLGKWVTHVDAHTGEIVWRYNDIHFVDFTGSASGDVRPDTYCNPAETQPFRYLRVQVAGLGSVNSDVNSNWTMPYGGVDNRTVTADLYGPYVDLNNVGGAEASFSVSATPGVPVEISYTDVNSRRDERDVFMAVNDIHDFFQLFAPSFAYPNGRINANVNRIDGFCPGNAWWDGTINFCAASGGNANTGEIQGVVHHEFGHGVQNAIIGFQGNEGLGEGNGDILANFLTRESIIGRGFFLSSCTTGIRNSDNTLQYPDDVVGQTVHNAGRVIAGFNWDAWEVLQAFHGVEAGTLVAAEAWHFGRVLMTPTDQPDQVLSAFVADDNNGNLNDGTPNYDAFCLGATNHGFTCPSIAQGVLIFHTPVATSTVPGDKVVQATITSIASPLDPAEVYVDWRDDDGPYERLFLNNVAGNIWNTTIEDVPVGAEIEYYVHAGSVAGSERTHPVLAPLYTHRFDVATIYDPQEAANGWVVNPDGDDTASASGVWVRVDPNGTSRQPEDDVTPAPGVLCWVTGNAAPGDPDGTADVDLGKTTLQSVSYDLTGASAAVVKYHRSFSNSTTDISGTDPWVVQVRNNGGAWQDLENTTEQHPAWLAIYDDLVVRFGASLGTVQFRFIARDNNPGTLVEGAVDEFEIFATLMDPAAADESATGARFALFPASPNPSRAGAAIRFQVPTVSHVELSIYDVNGREVRRLLDSEVGPGAHASTWDGRDNSGRPTASGLYYYELRAPGFTATRSLVVTR